MGYRRGVDNPKGGAPPIGLVWWFAKKAPYAEKSAEEPKGVAKAHSSFKARAELRTRLQRRDIEVEQVPDDLQWLVEEWDGLKEKKCPEESETTLTTSQTKSRSTSSTRAPLTKKKSGHSSPRSRRKS